MCVSFFERRVFSRRVLLVLAPALLFVLALRLFSDASMDSSRQQRLRVLLISDMHNQQARVLQLKRELPRGMYGRKCGGRQIASDHSRIHHILNPGDFGTLSESEQANDKAVSGAIKNMTGLIEQLESITCQVAFVPGNHDPKFLFDTDHHSQQQQISYSTNVHGTTMELAPGLVVVGFGGSVPASRGSEQDFWPGYPFHSDGEFSIAIKAADILRRVEEERCKGNLQSC